MLLPAHKQMIKITNRLVKLSKREQDYAFLDERLLGTVSVAVNEAQTMTMKMAELARKTLQGAMDLCVQFDEKKAQEVKSWEDELDKYEDKLGTFLVKLAAKSMSDGDSRRVSEMLHVIGDFERVGDHAMNLVSVAEEIYQKKVVFSESAQHQLTVLRSALAEVLTLTMDAYCQADRDQAVAIASRVEPLEEVIDRLVAAIRNAHIDRLQRGICTIQTGFVLSDLLNNYERISDHCSNIAVALIETHLGGFDTHEYLSDVKHQDETFAKLFKDYKAKYTL